MLKARSLLILALPLGLLAACNRSEPQPGAEATASVEAAPVQASGISIDTEGFKANIEMPGIEFDSDRMDIDGLMLPKGSKIKGIKVKALDRQGREHATVTFDFAAPLAVDVLATTLVDQSKTSDWGEMSRSTALDGATILRAVKSDGGKETIEYRLVADGTAATRGSATIVSDNATAAAGDTAAWTTPAG